MSTGVNSVDEFDSFPHLIVFGANAIFMEFFYTVGSGNEAIVEITEIGESCAVVEVSLPDGREGVFERGVVKSGREKIFSTFPSSIDRVKTDAEWEMVSDVCASFALRRKGINDLTVTDILIVSMAELVVVTVSVTVSDRVWGSGNCSAGGVETDKVDVVEIMVSKIYARGRKSVFFHTIPSVEVLMKLTKVV